MTSEEQPPQDKKAGGAPGDPGLTPASNQDRTPTDNADFTPADTRKPADNATPSPTAREIPPGGIRDGIKIAAPVALGMVPLGLAFGILMTQMGFSWYWTPIFSLVIYAGSMEFLAISLVTGGVGPISAGLYGLLVNFRHVFYALNYPLSVIRRPLAKAYGVYALTDETYAIVSANPNQRFSGRQIVALQATLQSGWVSGGIIGALFGDAIPWHIEGMEFALVALFVVLFIESFLSTRDASLVVTAAVAAAVGLIVSADNMLMIAMVLYFAALLIRFYNPGLDRAMRWNWGNREEREEV